MSELSPARQLILSALNLDRAQPSAGAAVHLCPEDWTEFAHLAAMHRLEPMLHERLRRGDLAEQVPPALRERLQAAHRKHTLRNLKITRELVTVTRLLRAGGIESMALKGAFLAQFAYPEPGLRPMRDLDLLLKPNEAVAAFNLLRGQGYESSFGGVPEAYFADRVHLPPLRGPGGIAIELHHRLRPMGAGTDAFEASLWSRGIEKPLGGEAIRFPCLEDMLLHLCIHATLDHKLDLGPLALVDVALAIESGPVDWPDFLLRVEAGGWRRCVLPVLLLARRHLGARVPDEVLAALGGGEGEAAWLESAEFLLFSDPEDHKLLDYAVEDILFSASLKDRLGKLAGAVFPPRTVIARHFPVSAGSALAYLYYPRRWFRLLTGKVPALLKAHSGRADSLRQLAGHRVALSQWLAAEGKAASAR